jgi:hypothetical protein
VLRARRRERARDAEIGHHGVAALQQDVLGLDVAMHEAARVREGEGIAASVARRKRLTERQPPFAAEPLAQRLALEERHDVVELRRRATLARTAPESNSGRMCDGRGSRQSRSRAGNRSAPSDAASSGRNTLIATRRWCFRSSAR